MTKPFDQPAFPQTPAVGLSGDVYWPTPEGMSLRDYFAAHALMGVLAFPGAVENNRNKAGEAVARVAYAYADAMLAERAK